MDDRQKLIRTIVLWSIYGTIMIVALITFAFNDVIYGVKVVNESGVLEWNPQPFFSIGAENIKLPLFRYLYEHAIPNTLHTIQIAAVAITFAIGLHYFAKIVFVGKKAKTVSRLVVSFVKWVIFLCALFFTMDAWGADTTTMLASAGVLTLIIGLGSQSLIADILAGIFIVFEGEFQVGDIVIIDTLELFGESFTIMKNPSVGLDVAVEATLLLIIAGTIAGLIPARKAAKVKPIEALRAE